MVPPSLSQNSKTIFGATMYRKISTNLFNTYIRKIFMSNIKRNHNHSIMSANIETFIFFDLETTGLIKRNYIPKITEISLVAAAKHSLLNPKGTLPRVMPRLTIPVNPKKPIPPIVTELTGLSNESLELSRSFDNDVWQLIKSFIEILPKPVCFVAHSGNHFDYPILWSELCSIGKSLSDDILAIDSYNAFQYHFKSSAIDSPLNYKLPTIYKHMVGVPICNHHSSENDCKALMECVIRIGSPFIEYAQHNANPLISFRKKTR